MATLFYPKLATRSLQLNWGLLPYPLFYTIYSVNAILFTLVLSTPVNFFLEWSPKPLAVFFQRLFNQDKNQ
jgi:hypothetical protein